MLKLGNGYDHTYVITPEAGGKIVRHATLKDPKSGRAMIANAEGVLNAARADRPMSSVASRGITAPRPNGSGNAGPLDQTLGMWLSV